MYPLTDIEHRYESEARMLRIESLRLILEKEQGRRITSLEASQIADQIINFFLTLAGDVSITETSFKQPAASTIPQIQTLNQLLAAPI